MQPDRIPFHPFTTVALALTLAVPAAAQITNGQSKTLTYDRAYGDAMAGGSVHTFGAMSFQTVSLNGNVAHTASASGRATADVTLFERRAELIRFEGSASAWDGRHQLNNLKQPFVAGKAGSTRLYLRIAGDVKVDQTLAESQDDATTYSWKVYDVERTFMLGYVPVTVRSTAHAGLDFGPRATVDVAGTAARIGGFVRPWGRGTGEASVGISGANAGIEVVITFLKTHAEAGVEGRATHVGGYMSIYMFPIELVLNLKATLLFKTWRQEVFRYLYPELQLLQRAS
jgi:hypothetical protein